MYNVVSTGRSVNFGKMHEKWWKEVKRKNLPPKRSKKATLYYTFFSKRRQVRYTYHVLCSTFKFRHRSTRGHTETPKQNAHKFPPVLVLVQVVGREFFQPLYSTKYSINYSTGYSTYTRGDTVYQVLVQYYQKDRNFPKSTLSLY
jgi:hypothetical protein